MAANTELLLKKFLKRRVKITAALITAFMITGKIITATTLNNYEVKDAISTKNGNVKMTNLKTLEIESNENNNNVEYEKNINASNGTVNITTEEKISLKDAKTGIFASGKNSTVKLVLLREFITVPISFHSGAFVLTGINAPSVALYNTPPFSSNICTPNSGFG